MLGEDAGKHGEKIAAELALAKIIDKYGISPDELREGEPKEWIRYDIKNKTERLLFMQICFAVLNRTSISIKKTGEHKSFFWIELTRAQRIEIDALRDFYIKEYKKELNEIKDHYWMAFVYRNKLMAQKTERSESSLSPQKINLIMSLIEIEKAATPPRKMIEG